MYLAKMSLYNIVSCQNVFCQNVYCGKMSPVQNVSWAQFRQKFSFNSTDAKTDAKMDAKTDAVLPLVPWSPGPDLFTSGLFLRLKLGLPVG
jgi:hypothetical protein